MESCAVLLRRYLDKKRAGCQRENGGAIEVNRNVDEEWCGCTKRKNRQGWGATCREGERTPTAKGGDKKKMIFFEKRGERKSMVRCRRYSQTAYSPRVRNERGFSS